ncbi:hypothetical protein [Candidatus Rhodobacter oscarellae]|uniref:hypothetical protein n=1 Tax=Candidatus Rhodobacter oscarellae TaxID=1675527 RepID=UPI000670E5D1|nr:hypothetical protein [Candidatus Rhodobacter lobularis]
MMNFIRPGLMLLSVIGLVACTAIESNRAGAPFLDFNGKPKRTQITASYSLPRRYLSFQVSGNADSMRDSTRFKVERQADQEIIGPDPSPLFRYEINYVPSRFSKDEVDFVIENQILKTVSVSTEDQTGEALINLARALGNISRLNQGLDTDPVPGAGVGAPPNTPIAKLRLDPTDPVSVARTRHILAHDATHGLELHVTPPPRTVSVIASCDHAVCYRPLISVTLTFVDKQSRNFTEFVVQVPDPHQITGLDIERSAFVKRDTIYTFADGTLASVDITKPSELAAASLLPLSIVTAVFEGTNQAISALLGLQKNELAASTELLNAQANFLNALKAYREVEEDVLGEETEEEVDQKEEDTV